MGIRTPSLTQELRVTALLRGFKAGSNNAGTFQQVFCCRKKRNGGSPDALLGAAQEQKQPDTLPLPEGWLIPTAGCPYHLFRVTAGL